MSRGKTIIGGLVLCALALCAFGAAGASAEGLTAYTCKEVTAGTGEFTDSMCETTGKGNFATVAIPENETTEVTSTNTGSTVFAVTLGGIKVTLTATELHSTTGDIKNITEGGVMKVHSTNITLHYTNVTATAGKKPCTVTGISGAERTAGAVRTNLLTAITSFNATEHHVTFKPEGATPVAEFEIGGAECPAVITAANPYVVTGEATGVIPAAKHSDITFSGLNGLHVNGSLAGEYNSTTHTVMKETENTIGIKTS